ncbi:MAG: hypothetical protein U5J63_12785 [Fodinibius sp.]|nr:hypothetical protein [Fodinibius sp.]
MEINPLLLSVLLGRFPKMKHFTCIPISSCIPGLKILKPEDLPFTMVLADE